MRFIVRIGNRQIKVRHSGPTFKVNDKEYTAHANILPEGLFEVRVDDEQYKVELLDISIAFNRHITAPMQGVITSIDVRRGQNVKEGQTMLRLIAMKMENEIKADKACTVKSIAVKEGQKVKKGDMLIELKR
jgi:biotin carboxyl carrier protein